MNNDSQVQRPALGSLANLTSLWVQDNDALLAIEVPALVGIDTLDVRWNGALSLFSMPSLTAAGYAAVTNKPLLPSCAVHAILDGAGNTRRTVSDNDEGTTCL